MTASNLPLVIPKEAGQVRGIFNSIDLGVIVACEWAVYQLAKNSQGLYVLKPVLLGDRTPSS